ncbi:FAD-dependent oxidoreductase [Actinomadura sp. 6K520]|uniref:dihydrolipoyl dehydrogenase family protein n=1 Tax=Actinomadura sp. 6K520 TaxID=2530364 RepID=UPI00104F7790|nr:FAD-dependent oxidoreductase [Actinomadura sp. 6K520]TDE35700.1 NAD(P)/FAD-dependent oxidoreductase [Actinomadura sp. 6K520]
MTTGSGHDLIVLGGGAAGLAAARTGAGLGARTLLVADGPIGGDCTFTGCVPSKTLIEHAGRGASFTEAMAAVRGAIQAIAATETAEVLRGEGIEVLSGRAAFRSRRMVAVGARELRAGSFVIATGARPAVPPVPGLADVPYLTSDTVFGLDDPPRSLAVLGGGTTGCELAQAFGRLGVEVTVVEAADRLLPQADPDASGVIADVFAREGITVRTGTGVVAAGAASGGVRLELSGGDPVEAQRLLVAVGRTPVTDGLGLDAAGVRTGDTGRVITGRRLATTAVGVYAAGDVTGRLQLTHAAYAMGRVAARNALGGRRKASYRDDATPRVVFTDPEVAQVGLTVAEAVEAGLDARVAELPMSDLDRAVTAGRTDGFVRLVAGPRRLLGHRGGGRVLGATIVAARAGEMIHEPALAMRTGMFTGRLAQTVHAYPTWSIAVQQAAAQFFGAYGGRTARRPER